MFNRNWFTTKEHTKLWRNIPTMFSPKQKTACFLLVVVQSTTWSTNYTSGKESYAMHIIAKSNWTHQINSCLIRPINSIIYNLYNYNMAFFCKKCLIFSCPPAKKNYKQCRVCLSCLGVDQHHLPFWHANIASGNPTAQRFPVNERQTAGRANHKKPVFSAFATIFGRRFCCFFVWGSVFVFMFWW